MDKKRIDHLLGITENHNPGYHTLMHFASWRVAIFNQDPSVSSDTLKEVAYHGLTDEVFLLLQGRGTLIIADGHKQPADFAAITMESGKCYNIRQGVWHALLLEDDGVALIVENDNTSKENSVSCLLTEQDRQAIKEAIRAAGG